VSPPVAAAHVVHCSLGRGYEIASGLSGAWLRAPRSSAASTTSTLDEENDVTRLGGKAKINPPIRPAGRGGGAVAAGGGEGNVTLVSTDHVSWSEDRKTNPDMLANASGVPGLEAMVPLFVNGALERGVSADLGGKS
jgi:allantoinase